VDHFKPLLKRRTAGRASSGFRRRTLANFPRREERNRLGEHRVVFEAAAMGFTTLIGGRLKASRSMADAM